MFGMCVLRHIKTIAPKYGTEDLAIYVDLVVIKASAPDHAPFIWLCVPGPVHPLIPRLSFKYAHSPSARGRTAISVSLFLI